MDDDWLVKFQLKEMDIIVLFKYPFSVIQQTPCQQIKSILSVK